MIRTSAAKALLLIALLALGIGAPFSLGEYYLGVCLTLCMWVSLTQSWVVLSGMTGYISLGHSVFYGTGAYVMVLLWQLVPIWAAIGLAGLVSGLLALLVGYPVLRVRGPYFVILTYGFAEFIKFVVVNVESVLGKSGRLLFGSPDLQSLYYLMFGLALAATLLCFAVRRSRFGAGLRALREDEEAAETLGVPAGGFKLLAFALSAFIPGMVGAVMVMRTVYFEPLQAFSPVVSFTVVTMAIIGGSDGVQGPILGVLFLTVLSELLWANMPETYMILLGILLVCFVLLAPDGIYGRLRSHWGARGAHAA